MAGRISIEERRQIQLKMLKEIDIFCRANCIRYSIAYGTLIGAVRHHGFIPWDDDVDLMMPMPDYITFKEKFRSSNIKICDVDSEKYYDYPFPRLAYRNTYDKTGIITKEYGVNIDLYLVMGISDDEVSIKQFFIRAKRIMDVRVLLKRIRKKVIQYLPINNIPLCSLFNRKYKDCHFEQEIEYSLANKYYAIGGPPDYANVFDYDLFEEMTDLSFEGLNLMSIGNYDKFLTSQYGDYMKLPPEEERRP